MVLLGIFIIQGCPGSHIINKYLIFWCIFVCFFACYLKQCKLFTACPELKIGQRTTPRHRIHHLGLVAIDLRLLISTFWNICDADAGGFGGDCDDDDIYFKSLYSP